MTINPVNPQIRIFGEKLHPISYLSRPGAYGICITHDFRVLLLKTPDGYFLPGGGIEQYESSIEALEREIIEETGYELNNSQFCCYATEFFFSYKRSVYYELQGQFYRIQIGDKIARPVEYDHEIEWHPVEKALSLLFMDYQRFALKQSLSIIL